MGRLAPVLWFGLAVAAALLASVLAGALAGATLPALVAISATRSGMDAVGVACVGLALVALLLPHGTSALPGAALGDLRRVRRSADRALVAFTGGWLALVVAGITFRTAHAVGRPVTTVEAGEVGRWVTQLAAGRGMALTAGCVAVVLACGVVRLRDPGAVQVRILLIAALLGVITPAVTGHTGLATDHELAVITVGVHVGAAALWVGGLGTVLVLVARHAPLLAAVLPRFSTLAGACLAAVTLSGVLNAVILLESWGALFTTGYGWLVVAKVAFLMLLAGLGWLARRRLATGRLPVLRWAGVETALMAVTIGVAAALGQTG